MYCDKLLVVTAEHLVSLPLLGPTVLTYGQHANNLPSRGSSKLQKKLPENVKDEIITLGCRISPQCFSLDSLSQVGLNFRVIIIRRYFEWKIIDIYDCKSPGYFRTFSKTAETLGNFQIIRTKPVSTARSST